jgi:hypothetical protein
MTLITNFLMKYLFSPRAFASYILIFAIAIGTATFIENDFGTSAAQKLIFKTKWFEFLLLLFSGALIANIIRFKLISQKKWTILMFHLAMVVIIIGAGITRYTGFEGIMHIREAESSNSIVSSDMYIKFFVEISGNKFEFEEPVLFASIGNQDWIKSFNLNGRILKARVTKFLPNPQEILKFDEKGIPTLKIVFGGNSGRQEYFLQKGDVKNINGLIFNFSQTPILGSIEISENNGQPFIKTESFFSITTMATQAQSELEPGVVQPLQLRSLYQSSTARFVFGDFAPKGKVIIESGSKKLTNESLAGLTMEVSFGGNSQVINIYGRKGTLGVPSSIRIEDAQISVGYGSKIINLPFSLYLRDFEMERYPGTNNAASYASEVTLVDQNEGIQEERRIYMNNILNHKGYRFFQSSFDQDELGTYLSVNHDFWGTWISYLGYFLLTFGMIMTLLSPHSRFSQLSEKLKSMRNLSAATLLFFLNIMPVDSFSQNIIDNHHAKKFSKIIMQDFRGRMKPLHTFNNEVLRKLSRKTEIDGLSANQIVLGMTANPKDWYGFDMIKSIFPIRIFSILMVHIN